jgi:glycosyltransferase involved in cell wall biosynthesis
LDLDKPLISVIIAVFNGVKTLQQCIDSIAQQTYVNIELMIIDGGSKDGTIDILKENQEHISYWVSEPDQGIYNAWNKALAQASGEWIYFLGADDFFWDSSVLSRMALQLAEIPPDICIAYGQIMLLTINEQNLYLVGAPWEKTKPSFTQVMSIPHQGLMHRSSLFEKHGKFDESFKIVGDYELLLRELINGQAVFIPDIIISGMRQGGISSEPESSLKMLYELRRAQVKHGLNLPGKLWVMAIVRVYIRLILWRILGEKLARKSLDFGRRIMGLHRYWTKTS